MAVSYIHSEPAREMLQVRTEQGLEMSSALLIYLDGNGDVCWHGSDNMRLTEAVWLMEKVKLELLNKP